MLCLPFASLFGGPKADFYSTTNVLPPSHHQVGEDSIQYMSDLHLENEGYQKFRIPFAAPNLLLVGDIGNIKDEPYIAFLEELCTRYKRVLLVPGNHEYFHMNRDKAQATMAQLGDRFVWMDRKRVDIEENNIIVLGCTLHSKIDRASRRTVEKEIKGLLLRRPVVCENPQPQR